MVSRCRRPLHLLAPQSSLRHVFSSMAAVRMFLKTSWYETQTSCTTYETILALRDHPGAAYLRSEGPWILFKLCVHLVRGHHRAGVLNRVTRR